MNLREGLAPYAIPPSQLGATDESGLGAIRPPSEGELANACAAPGYDADVPLGVLYQADWKKRSDGMARHAREQARALALYLPLNLTAITPLGVLDDELDPEVINEVNYLQRVHCARYAVAIRHIVCGHRQYVRNIVSPGGARLAGEDEEAAVWRSTVVYTSWERDCVDLDLAEDLARVGQVWVPCEANRQAFERSGIAGVRVVPYPYDPTTHGTTAIAAPRGPDSVPSDKRFYAIGKWEPRKALDQLLGAFLLAFGPRDRASLVIKTFSWGRWKNYPSLKEAAQSWLNDAAVVAQGWTAKNVTSRVRLIDRDLSEADLIELHRRNNIYVSASHGEAWDIPAFDACCAGNSLVDVGYGGSAEYAVPNGTTRVRVPHHMGPVHQDYGWEPQARWANYQLSDLVAALRVAEPPARRLHPLDFASRFGRVAVGAKMRDFICALVERENVGLAEALRSVGTYG